MDQLEKVEKIREKTGVSYEEAKAALEAAGGDVLDALVYLENEGKIKKPDVSVYSTKSEPSPEFKEATETYTKTESQSFGDLLKKFLQWCGKMIDKGCHNFFIVSKNGEDIITIPVIVLVLLAVITFSLILILLLVGLFFGFHYRFEGAITKTVDVNMACDKAAEAVESLKDELKK